jgi:hypothetical protein
MKATTNIPVDATFKTESVRKVEASKVAAGASMKAGNFTNMMDRFNGMVSSVGANTSEISQAFMKDEEL